MSDLNPYEEGLTMELADARERLLAASRELATCLKYRDAYAEMDRIGTQAVRDLEAKLAKAVERLEAWLEVAARCSIEEGVCCCGDNMENHTNPMDCGHSPVDHGSYVAMHLVEATRATLAELKGAEE